jgi:modulator of FtsH protease HflC
MNGLWRNPVAIGIAALAALILFANIFVIVPETEQAVVLEMNRPVGTVNAWHPNQPFGDTGAGLTWVWPGIDRLVWVDKRVMDVDLDNQQLLSTDQRRLEVDAYARFRIVDPVKMVVTARSETGVTDTLNSLFVSALRAELGREKFATLLSPERGEVMDNIRTRLQRAATPYGVQIVDVRIKHVDLPTGSPLDSALQRMASARHLEAATIAADGARDARIIMAQADGQAAQIYAASYGKDPAFYDFFRAMKSYRYTFNADRDSGRGTTNFVLSPNNDYLRQFEGRGAGK